MWYPILFWTNWNENFCKTEHFHCSCIQMQFLYHHSSCGTNTHSWWNIFAKYRTILHIFTSLLFYKTETKLNRALLLAGPFSHMCRTDCTVYSVHAMQMYMVHYIVYVVHVDIGEYHNRWYSWSAYFDKTKTKTLFCTAKSCEELKCILLRLVDIGASHDMWYSSAYVDKTKTKTKTKTLLCTAKLCGELKCVLVDIGASHLRHSPTQSIRR